MTLLLRSTLCLWLPLLSPADSPAVVAFGARSEVHLCSDSILRIVHRPSAAGVEKSSLIVPEGNCKAASINYNVSTEGDLTILTTSTLRVTLSNSKDSVESFEDHRSKKILLKERSHEFVAVRDPAVGKGSFQVEQSWFSSTDEALYGGGSYQNGFVNFKNAPLEMLQFNTEAVIPFFLSSAGYGLLWDNSAWTFLNPPSRALVEPGPTVAGWRNGSVEFVPETDGDHFFYVGLSFPEPGSGSGSPRAPRFGSSGKWLSVEVLGPGDERQLVQGWSQLANMPSSLTGRASGLKAGVAYRVQYSWDFEAGLFVQSPILAKTSGTRIRSAFGGIVDYYFVYEGSMSASLGAYRTLTGAAPLYGRWTYGFWQCKEHYATQKQVLDAAEGFRNRSIPVDAIVQDWHYWGDLGWGPQWDPKVYPDPTAMVSQLHAQDMHFMVSVWSKFDEKTSFYKEMLANGWILKNSTYYDAWNPRARELFYNFSEKSHFSRGVDSLWLDATEPEGLPNSNEACFLGSGNALMNSYSLVTTQAIADGLRKNYPNAQGSRVFSLTRSAFAGQQRTGAALWTGDTTASWDSLRRQVVSSINYQLSGMPYWSQDIGGFFRPHDQYDSSSYKDLMIRWFQFGVFTPIFRVHGCGSKTELWNYGAETMTVVNSSAVSLRYRLFPYIYSGFWRVETQHYTMLRALVLDFNDPQVYNVADEFMFGDALLVTPIVEDPGHARPLSREVLLPGERDWVHFHTGQRLKPGRLNATFAMDQAPAFARSGSILVLGPVVQNLASPTAELEIRIYTGSDAKFTLFEDDGVSQRYRSGETSIISFEWKEDTQELVVGERQGAGYMNMPKERKLAVVWVRPGHGVGTAAATDADQVVTYRGERIVVKREELVV